MPHSASVWKTVSAMLVALIATLIGVFLYTDLPKTVGFWTFLENLDPRLVGLLRALPEDWNYSIERLYSNDLTGQYAIVTGASAGIGFAMAETLAGRLNAHVTMACRNPEKCTRKKDEILSRNPHALISTMTMDTSSLQSVNQFANDYLASKQPLDMLFLNAGSCGFAPKAKIPCMPLTPDDGLEVTFQVNYLGHHLLYRKLEPLLLYGDNDKKIQIPARVVQTSSAAAYRSYSFGVATTIKELNGCINHTQKAAMLSSDFSYRAYGQSKLAQILWVEHLTNQLAAAKTTRADEDDEQSSDPTASHHHRRDIIANAFNPGFAATEIFDKVSNLPQALRTLITKMAHSVGWSSLEGALTGLYLGVETQDLMRHDIRGKYYHPQVTLMTNHPLDSVMDRRAQKELQEKLWEFSDSLIQEYL